MTTNNNSEDDNPSAISTAQLDELRQLGEELRALFAHERKAIAKLDHAALTFIANQKFTVAGQLGTAKAKLAGPLPREIRELFAAIRAEARATSMLANTAAEAVRSLLGYEAPTGYDRRARQTQTRQVRLLMTY